MKTSYRFDLSDGTRVICGTRDLAERMRRVYEGKEAVDPRVQARFKPLGLKASPVQEVKS